MKNLPGACVVVRAGARPTAARPLVLALAVTTALCGASALERVQAQERTPADPPSRNDSPRGSLPSPALRIERDSPPPRSRRPPTGAAASVRSVDGSHNNPHRVDMGAAHTPLARIGAARYDDGVASLTSAGLPGPREISNALAALPTPTTRVRATDYLWQWGQFLDHDLSLTDGVVPAESADIDVPVGDPWFDPDGEGRAVIPFNRSLYERSSGTSRRDPRQQINEITHWIDASNVYGSDERRAAALRTLDGTGRLKTSAGNLLPFNADGLPNAGGSGQHLFLAGDVRANEQLGLTALHTLFVREHNRLVALFAAADPALDGEALYQKARRVVGGQMQHITYEHYLPVLLGRRPLSRYRGYAPRADGTLSNLFTTALYRYGHSALGETIERRERDGRVSPHGHLRLREAFFQPHRLATEGGLEPILRGLAAKACQPIDLHVTDSVRNFLFGEPGRGGFDLLALNIQRGRDHGLASYNQARVAYGLRPKRGFDGISRDPAVRATLEALYTDVDDVDAWVGALAEDTRRGMAGQLLRRGLKEQFEALRDADRFWYEIYLDDDEMAQVTTLAEIIRRNTDIGAELPDDVFRL